MDTHEHVRDGGDLGFWRKNLLTRWQKLQALGRPGARPGLHSSRDGPRTAGEGGRRSRQDDVMTRDNDEEIPDFAAEYASPDMAPLTPRLAAHLWVAAGVLADTYRPRDAAPLLIEELPPIVGRVADAQWLDNFVSGFDALAARLGTGGFELVNLATCT